MMLIALLVVSTFTQPADPAALMREGFTLLEKNQNAGAVAAFHACLARAQAQADRLLEGECTRGLGRAAQARRDFVTARGLFESAHAMLAAIGNQPALGRSYNDRAFLAYLESRWPDVRELYGRAAEAFAAAGMRPEQAAALRSLTFAQDLTVAEKIRVLDGAHALAVESGATRIEALVLHMWGDMLFMQGEYATSIEKTERAVALLEPLDDPASLARALTSLGRLYRVHGAPQRAIDVYRRILATQERAGDIGGQAQTHNAIASALSVLEKHAEALGHLRRALELATVEGSKSLIQFQTSAYAFGTAATRKRRRRRSRRSTSTPHRPTRPSTIEISRWR
jgi:tetratricopeptide (TPR) repeat protein